MEKALFNEGLGCCACEDKTAGFEGGLTCADKRNIFTNREQKVLAKIREVSRMAGALKAEISRTDEAGRQAGLKELERLRKVRAVLEVERVAASEERMRLLGHLP
jgi:hypothetical protein